MTIFKFLHSAWPIDVVCVMLLQCGFLLLMLSFLLLCTLLLLFRVLHALDVEILHLFPLEIPFIWAMEIVQCHTSGIILCLMDLGLEIILVEFFTHLGIHTLVEHVLLLIGDQSSLDVQPCLNLTQGSMTLCLS